MFGLMPLFPLRMVAFPGSAVPLHIFEDRYREMVGEAEANGTEFGILLANDGGVVDIGCAVTVEEVLQRYPDGRFDVMTRGQRRFSVLSVNEDRDYLRGEVEFFDDTDWAEVPVDLKSRALAAWARVAAATGEQGKSEDAPDPTVARLSFEIAQRVDDLEFQNTMLRMRSESERLRHFIDYAEGHVDRLLYQAKMRRVAPMNGSGHKPKGI